jgi:16S rRNA (guanine(966)-N(2))-methyltransferase RsmD
VREALFSILISKLGNLANLRVLDLFAGTGALGIEALSRGAAHAVFIDTQRSSIRLIEKNLALTGFTAEGTAIAMDARQALVTLTRQGDRFDIVFCDPPYRDIALRDQVLEVLGASGLLTQHAVVVLEGAASNRTPDSFGQLTAIDRRTYGDTSVKLFTLLSGE